MKYFSGSEHEILAAKKISICINNSLRHYRIRRILVSRLRFMGDIILTTPLVSALNEHYPEAKIDYLAEPPYIELLKNNPKISGLISFDRKLYSQLSVINSIKAQWKLIRILRQKKYDLAIDLFGIPRSAWLMWLTGAPIRVGGCFRYRSHLYTYCFNHKKNWTTAIDFHQLALNRIGILPALSKPEIFLTKNELEWAKNYIDKRGFDPNKPIIGIYPGATWPAKIWPIQRFVQLANQIAKNLEGQIFIVVGPDDKSLIEKMFFNQNPKVIVGDLLNLRKLAAVIYYCDLFISNDCGPMHIAPAVSTPTIGIFGPGDPLVWFPYDRIKGHRVIIKDIDCRPCNQNECSIQHQCMTKISVEEVYISVKEVLYAR